MRKGSVWRSLSPNVSIIDLRNFSSPATKVSTSLLSKNASNSDSFFICLISFKMASNDTLTLALASINLSAAVQLACNLVNHASLSYTILISVRSKIFVFSTPFVSSSKSCTYVL